MTRTVNVIVGKPTGQQNNQEVTLNDPVLAGQSDGQSVVVTPTAPQNYARVIDDAEGLQDNRVIQENNRFDVVRTEAIALTDSRNVVQTPGGGALPTLFGLSMQDSDFANPAAKWNFYRNTFDKIPVYRSFTPPGPIKKFNTDADLQQFLATPECKRILISLKGSATDSVSGNSVYTLADIDAWFSQNQFPSENSGTEVWLSWFHEPNGNWEGATNLARYRDLTRTLCDYVHTNGPSNLKIVSPIWASGNIIYNNQGQFTDWYPGSDPQGVPYADYVGIDIYSRPFRSTALDSSEGHAGYLRLEEIFDNTSIGTNPKSFWDAIDAGQLPSRSGKWICAEFASTNVGDPVVSGFSPLDPNDTRRALWLQQCVTRLQNGLRPDCEAILWWNSIDQGDYRLWAWNGSEANPDADPMVPVWRNAMVSSSAARGFG